MFFAVCKSAITLASIGYAINPDFLLQTKLFSTFLASSTHDPFSGKLVISTSQSHVWRFVWWNCELNQSHTPHALAPGCDLWLVSRDQSTSHPECFVKLAMVYLDWTTGWEKHLMQLLPVFCIPRFEAKWRICLQAPKQKEIKTTCRSNNIRIIRKMPQTGATGHQFCNNLGRN